MKNNVNNACKRGFSSAVHTVYAIGDLVARDFNANGRNNTKPYEDCCEDLRKKQKCTQIPVEKNNREKGLLEVQRMLRYNFPSGSTTEV